MRGRSISRSLTAWRISITAGSLRAGDRVPSVRRLSGQQKSERSHGIAGVYGPGEPADDRGEAKVGLFVKPRLSESLAEPAVCGKTSRRLGPIFILPRQSFAIS